MRQLVGRTQQPLVQILHFSAVLRPGRPKNRKMGHKYAVLGPQGPLGSISRAIFHSLAVAGACSGEKRQFARCNAVPCA